MPDRAGDLDAIAGVRLNRLEITVNLDGDLLGVGVTSLPSTTTRPLEITTLPRPEEMIVLPLMLMRVVICSP